MQVATGTGWGRLFLWVPLTGCEWTLASVGRGTETLVVGVPPRMRLCGRRDNGAPSTATALDHPRLRGDHSYFSVPSFLSCLTCARSLRDFLIFALLVSMVAFASR